MQHDAGIVVVASAPTGVAPQPRFSRPSATAHRWIRGYRRIHPMVTTGTAKGPVDLSVRPVLVVALTKRFRAG